MVTMSMEHLPDLREHCGECNGEGYVPVRCTHAACQTTEAWGTGSACRTLCPSCGGDGKEQADGFSAPEGVVLSMVLLREVA